MTDLAGPCGVDENRTKQYRPGSGRTYWIAYCRNYGQCGFRSAPQRTKEAAERRVWMHRNELIDDDDDQEAPISIRRAIQNLKDAGLRK